MGTTIKLNPIPPELPQLVSFPLGSPTNSAEFSIKQINSKKRELSSNINGTVFKGFDFDNFNPKFDTCRYMIGELDQKKNQLSLFSFPHAYVMKPFKLQSKAEDSSQSYFQKKQSLTEEFGSRKKKRALAAAQSNIISEDNIAGVKTVQQSLLDKNEETGEDETEDVQSGAQMALELNRKSMLPPFDVETSVVENAYPIDTLIPSSVNRSILEFLQSTRTVSSLSLGNIEQQNNEEDGFPPLTQILHSESFLQENRALPYILSNFPHLKNQLSSALSAVGEKKTKKKSSKSSSFSSSLSRVLHKVRLSLYLHLLLQFYKLAAKYTAKEAFFEAVTLPGAGASLVRCFGSLHHQLTMTKTQMDKLLMHCIVVGLTLFDFSLNLTPFAEDLKIPVSRLSALSREVGCKAVNRSHPKATASLTTDEKEELESSGISLGEGVWVDLTAPLIFPTLRKKRTK